MPPPNDTAVPIETKLTRALPRVTILLATYNGACHLQEQLMSYCAQQHTAWDLWVSDDGSDDTTRAILDDFCSQHGAGRIIRVLDGPRQGPAANFMSLLTHPELPTDGPVALSDQDDVWHPEKLHRALTTLQSSGPMTLYSGQSYHADSALKVIGQSQPPPRATAFRNALTQNVISGHSIVMDANALALVRQAGMPRNIPYHDWWLYLLISGAGGTIYVDTARMIHYRQHNTNAMGAHAGLRATLHRTGQVLGRTYGGWIVTNVEALSAAAPLLTAENRKLLDTFTRTHRGPLRAWALWNAGLYRQSRLASACFYIAAILGRL